MANKDQLRGMIPLRHLTGGEIRVNEYIVTTGATVYKGDILKVVAAGTVEAAAADDGVIVVGVAAEYATDSASAGGVVVKVYDDPYIVFLMQADTGTAVAATAVFATANHVATTGDTTTFISKHELDSSDIGTGAQLKIIGKHGAIDNTWAEHVDLEVIFNEHLYKAAVAGV